MTLEEENEYLRRKLDTYERLRYKLVSLYPELAESPFICSYDKNSGIPQWLHVCPAYGSDHVFTYKLQEVNLAHGE